VQEVEDKRKEKLGADTVVEDAIFEWDA